MRPSLRPMILLAVAVLAACSSEGTGGGTTVSDEPTTAASTPSDSTTRNSTAPESTRASEPPSDASVPEPATTTSTPPTSTTDPAAPTPWTEAVDAFDPEGEPDVAAALGLFQMVFGAVPAGPAVPPDAGVRAEDASLAVRAVMGVWDRLSPEQQGAVDAALHPADAADRELGIRRGSPSVPTDAPDPKLVDAVVGATQTARSLIAAKLGSDFTGTVKVTVSQTNDKDKDFAVAEWINVLKTGAFSGDCHITFFAQATDAGAESLLNTATHEMFHCFQFAAIGSAAEFAKRPKWVIEGGAEWVGTTLTFGDAATARRWRAYLTRPQVPLPLRAYDALGFWSHLAHVGIDPWSVMNAVLAAGPSAAAFEAAGANSPAFLDTWASGMSRLAERGPAWDTDGPEITADRATPQPLAVPPSGQQALNVVPYANGLWAVQTDAEVLTVSAIGDARLSDGTIDTTELASARFCRLPTGCTCPNVPNDIPPAPLLGDVVLALSGAPSGSSAIVGGATLQEHCEEREHRPVQVVFDRPAVTPVLAGRVLDLVSCTGPYGDWTGNIFLGGISYGGIDVPFQPLPLAFSVGGVGTIATQAATAGVVHTPVFDLSVDFTFTITVDGTNMTIDFVANGDTGVVQVGPISPEQLPIVLPIQDAPPEACPEPAP